MTEEVSMTPDSGHVAETPSEDAHWIEEAIPAGVGIEQGGDTVPLNEHPTLRKYDSLQEMAKALVHADGLVGKKTVGLTELPENATEEERNTFASELRRITGVPDAPYGYDVSLPEGMEVDPTVMDWFKDTAHAVGLSPEQAQGLSDHYNELVQEQNRQWHQADRLRKVDGLKALSAQWGSDAPKNTELARRGFLDTAKQAGFSEEDTDMILSSHGDDPLLIRLFQVVGQAQAEDTLTGFPGNVPGNKEQMTPEQFFAEVVFGGKGA